MTEINVYINFNGQCREAMNFYKDCLGGELELQKIEGSPIEQMCPPTMKDQIMHATLIKGKLLLMGSDMTGPGGYVKGNDVALSVNCESEAEINSLFTSLSEGGSIIDPLKKQFWGAWFVVFTDKFGIRWMLNCNEQ